MIYYIYKILANDFTILTSDLLQNAKISSQKLQLWHKTDKWCTAESWNICTRTTFEYIILIYASKLTNIPTFDCIFCFQSYTKSRSLQSLSAHQQAADLQEMANAKELKLPCLQSESEVLKLQLQVQIIAHYPHESYTMTTSKLSLAASCKNAIIQHILETTF